MYRPVAPKKEMTKSEMIELIVVRTPVRTAQEQQQLRKDLSAYSAEELDNYIQLAIAEDKFHEALAESAAERLRYQLWLQETREPQRKAEEKAQLAADRETFVNAAKSLQSFGLTEANFNVTRQILGPGFTSYDIQQGLASNALQLSPATQAELAEWDRVAKEAEIRRLKSMDLISLRKVVREEGARGPVTPPLDETQRVRQAERDAAVTFEKLPPDISAEDILAASPSKLVFLKQKYGNAQLDAVLNDYRQANAVINKL